MRKAWLVLLGAVALGACAHPQTIEVAHTIVAAALPGPQLDGALASTTLPAIRDSVVTARLSIDSHADSRTPRPALNVALCLDTSGSMEGKAIEDARAAALSFLAGIHPGDGFSLVTFDSTVRVVVPPTHLEKTTDLEPIRAAIRSIRAQGTTDMADGLRAAIQNVQALYDGSRVNRVVLVSDGVPNDGSQLRALAQQAQQAGISLSAMGLGLDYDEILMGDLAQTGGGRFKYIDDSSKIASYLSDELTRISRVSARSATLEIEPGPGVVVESIVGLPTSPTGRGGLLASLGDISLGSHRDVFFRMRAHGRRDGAAVELADATLRYVGSDGATHEEHLFFGAHASASDDDVAKSKNDDVERGALAAQKAADAIEAIRKAHDTDLVRRAPANGAVMPAPVAPAVMKREHAAAMRTLLGD
ncbi:MAG TPA: VWA domain-containing protein [Polyangiaceae bacterium]|jgi:Ca-activated chloride channel family protein